MNIGPGPAGLTVILGNGCAHSRGLCRRAALHLPESWLRFSSWVNGPRHQSLPSCLVTWAPEALGVQSLTYAGPWRCIVIVLWKQGWELSPKVEL